MCRLVADMPGDLHHGGELVLGHAGLAQFIQLAQAHVGMTGGDARCQGYHGHDG